jgi:hypothetical protein
MDEVAATKFESPFSVESKYDPRIKVESEIMGNEL